jgi:hemoglobin
LKDQNTIMQTVYEAAGGREGLLKLAHAWHVRVLQDEVVAHAFSHGFHPQHTERLAAYWIEALGGPADYSAQYGDETSVVRMHSGNGPHEEMDRRAIACFDQAMDDVGITAGDPLRRVLHDYFAWATTTTMARYHGSADDVPDGMRVPKWSWDGLVSAETNILRDAYAAINRNDILGFVAAFDQDVERIEPDDFPGGGTYRGLEAVREHTSRERSTWAEGSCQPERFTSAGDKIIVLAHVHVRLNGRTDWIDAKIADGYTFRDGKVREFRTFVDERQALKWAGVEAPGAD